MISINRTTSNNPDFISLTKLLDEELLKIYKSEQEKFDKHNILEKLTKSIVIYDNQTPVACGAFKEIKEQQAIEVKRMFVLSSHRSKGIGKLLLSELENWATELKFKSAILKTGDKQHAALSLYKKLGYSQIAKFPPYEHMHDSICLKKKLN